MTTSHQLLRDVEIVHLDIRIFTGQRKLEPGDFDRVRPGDLPDENVASLGSKRTVSPETLAPLKAIRYRAEKICSTHGVRFMGAYAIPQDRVTHVSEELAKLMAEFRQEKDQFLADYDDLVDDWVRLNPKFEDQIRRAKLPVDVVRSRFHAAFTIYRVTASERDATSSLSSAPDSLLEAVLGDLLTELASHIERTKVVVNEQTLRVEARKTITAAAEKLQRFSFLMPDGSLAALATQLKNAVVGTGQITGDEYRLVKAILDHLWDMHKLRQYLASLAGVVVAPVQTSLLDLAPAAASASQDAEAAPTVSPAPPALSPAPPPAPLTGQDQVEDQSQDSVWEVDDLSAPPVSPAPRKALGLRVSSLNW